MIELDVQRGCWVSPQGPGDSGRAFRLVATGDVCPAVGHRLDRCFSAGAEEAAKVYGDVLGELARKELSVTNLETTLSDRGLATASDGPVLRGPPAAVTGVLVGQFDVVTLANNHAMDMGPQALLDSRRLLRQAGVETVGAGEDLAEATRLVIVQRSGWRVGFLAFAEHRRGAATTRKPGTAPLDPGPSCNAVRAARDQCDLLIVLVHGGHEYCTFPSPGVRRDYRALAQAGADAVIGHHPHVVQGMELHGGVPILYSLGNFLFWADARDVPKLWWIGLCVRLHFAARRCVRIDVHPVGMNRRTGGARLLRGRRKECFLKWINRLSTYIADTELHERLWRGYCVVRLGYILSTSLQASRDIGLARGDTPLRRQRAAQLQALFDCEAQREVAATALEWVRQGPDSEHLFQGDEVYALTRSPALWKRRRIARLASSPAAL